MSVLKQLKQSSKRDTAVWAVIGALIGLAVFLVVHTPASLCVTNDSWLLHGYVEQDILQHDTGWLFYRNSAWSWPLGMAQNINYLAGGCSVLFTDSIPLAAVFFKILSPLLPATFQYFGLWVLLCYILQGVAASLLLRLFSQNWVAVAAGILLLCTSPIMMERAFRHTSLASHFLVLFALYYYFSDRREGFCFRAGWLVLMALAASIHVYFIPMLYAILFASLLQNAILQKKWGICGGYLLCNFAVTLAVLYLLGGFTADFTAGSTPYGYFTMNLNALWNPVSRGNIIWSRVLQVKPSEMGSLEGFNYLGLGVLCCLPFAALFALLHLKTVLWPAIRRHWGLLLVCVCLSAFAVSNVVIFSGAILVTLPIPDKLMQLCTIFRASGRMFWPVWYLLVLAVWQFLARGLSAVCVKTSRWLPAVACLLMVGVQLVDMQPAMVAKRVFFTQPTATYENPMQNRFWAVAAQNYDKLIVIGNLPDNLFVAHYAAENGMLTDIVLAARYDAQQRTAEQAAQLQLLLDGQIDSDTLYLFGDGGTFQKVACALGDKALLAKVDGFYVAAPQCEALNGFTTVQGFTLFEDLPLTILEYSDTNWDRGVLTWDYQTIAFDDNAYTRSLLENADRLVCDGVSYLITKTEYKDNWIMLTMDMPDARILCGKPLTPVVAQGNSVG